MTTRLEKKIADRIYHSLCLELASLTPELDSAFYEKVARGIIAEVIDDGQYAVLEDNYIGCCPDCTAAHNALWDKISRLEERLDKAAEAHHKKKKSVVENGGQAFTPYPCQLW